MLPKATQKWTSDEAKHLLNRAGFGGSPEDVEKLHALGREKAVDSLLNPTEPIDSYPKPAWAEMKTALDSYKQQMMQRREMKSETSDMSAAEAEKKQRTMRREIQQERRQHGVEAQAWWFRRMLTTAAPLREKMTLFWHDHFATSIQKVRQPVLLMNQNELFRAHAFGNFRKLTLSIVEDPAMMLYLDTQRSSKTKPNENFAREVMELFTLGEGNYTEADVKEAARAFTGYSLNPANGQVLHRLRKWDAGEKTIFEQKGRFKGADVINLIFEKDACAEFMATKLWEYFAYQSPPESAVRSLASTLRSNEYELKPVLREIFLSAEFYGEKSMGTQIKCPVQYLVQMLKELEMETPLPGLPIRGQVQLGQVLFMPPNVAGWDWGKAWINTNTLLTRYNLAGSVTKGSFDGGGKSDRMKMMRERKIGKGKGGMRNRMERSAPGPEFSEIAAADERDDTASLVAHLITRLFSVPIPEKARTSFIQYADSKKGVAFTDKELGELCHLMMSTPYYQLC